MLEIVVLCLFYLIYIINKNTFKSNNKIKEYF
jgi:hypothetical protein